MEREIRKRTGKALRILEVYGAYAFAVLMVRLMIGMELPVPVLWIGEAGFGVSMLMLPGAVYAEDPDKDEKFFGSILILFGLLLIVGAAGIF